MRSFVANLHGRDLDLLRASVGQQELIREVVRPVGGLDCLQLRQHGRHERREPCIRVDAAQRRPSRQHRQCREHYDGAEPQPLPAPRDSPWKICI